MPVAMLLILVVLLSASSGIYAGASFFAQQGPGVTVTTTLYTTTTSWTISTIWSVVTQTVQGVLTTVQYTTSTSTATVTGPLPTIKTVSANGNAQIDTAQSKFGGASGQFDGNGDYLSLADSADWAFGSGDFTIDFWVRWNALPGPGGIHQLFGQREDGNNDQGAYIYNSAGTILFGAYYISGGVTHWNIGAVTDPNLVEGTWYHFAVVRSGTAVRVYQGGSQIGSSYTVNGVPADIAAALIIGASGFLLYPFNGWLDEFRVSKGIARWTSNFSPPISPYARDANTALLLHTDGADASTTFIDSY